MEHIHSRTKESTCKHAKLGKEGHHKNGYHGCAILHTSKYLYSANAKKAVCRHMVPRHQAVLREIQLVLSASPATLFGSTLPCKTLRVRQPLAEYLFEAS